MAYVKSANFRFDNGLVVCLLALILAACDGKSTPNETGSAGGSASTYPDASGLGVHPQFEPAEGPMTLGAVPWPDDLYLDARGRVALTAAPGKLDKKLGDAFVEALRDLDGFGATTPIYFFFDGDVDEASLPVDAKASLASNASVFLIDADTASPDAFERVPVTFTWTPVERRLTLRPLRSHPLVAGRRYAAVVTRKLEDADGEPVEALPRFLAVRDSDSTLVEPRLLQARASYAPVIDTLVADGLARKNIVALAVFRVQSVMPDMSDARALVRSSAVASPIITSVVMGRKLDALFGRVTDDVVGVVEGKGTRHDQLLAVAQGTLPSPNFLSATAKAHGAFERDETGALRIKRIEDVPFSLFWPKVPQRVAAGARIPVVIYQHGLGRERSDAVVVANALAARGIAVIAIDAPFHGSRAPGSDVTNHFTGEEDSDGFGDAAGDFPGVSETTGTLTALHPFYFRDALRQGAVDVLSVVRSLEAGDWSVLAEFNSALAGATFDADHVGFLGVDIGAQMGVLSASVEPRLGALVLGFGAGGLTQNIAESPAHRAWFAALAKRLGHENDEIEAGVDPLVAWPELALFQMLVERAEPMAFASELRHRPTNVLLLSAQDDEVVPNEGTEALAFALGATLIGGPARYVDELPIAKLGPDTGIRGNYSVVGDSLSRVLYPLEPATHDSLVHATGNFEFKHPLVRPFELLEAQSSVANPTMATLGQLTRYFDDWHRCASTVGAARSVCGAPVYVQ